MLRMNLLLAWLWIPLGFTVGATLGMFFHREDWLGGYGSFQRRMYRLAHISFFGLGILNLLFYFTFLDVSLWSVPLSVASWGFAIGALTMPLCCFVVARQPRLHLIFAVPVTALVVAGFTAFWEVVRT